MKFLTDMGKKLFLFAVVFSFAAIAIAAADAHQWQLPVGGYNAGVRQWGVDTNGSIVSTSKGYSVPIMAGLKTPQAEARGSAVTDAGGVFASFDSNFTFAASPTCTCTDSASSAMVQCAPTTTGVQITAIYLDGGPTAAERVAFDCIGLFTP